MFRKSERLFQGVVPALYGGVVVCEQLTCCSGRRSCGKSGDECPWVGAADEVRSDVALVPSAWGG